MSYSHHLKRFFLSETTAFVVSWLAVLFCMDVVLGERAAFGMWMLVWGMAAGWFAHKYLAK